MEVDGYLLQKKLSTSCMAALWRAKDLDDRQKKDVGLSTSNLMMKVPLFFSTEEPMQYNSARYSLGSSRFKFDLFN